MSIMALMGAIEIGLLFGIVAMAVYLTYRICDFPDLTVDGSFPLGAAIAAKLLVSGWDPILAVLLATGGGAIAGLCTGLLYTRLQISPLLSGIITMIALYSINLRIMGSSNLSFFYINNLYVIVPKIILFAIIAVTTLVILGYFLCTELGLAFRASGSNPLGSEMQGIHANRMKLIALILSNALVSMAGSIYAQSQGFADITMGTGTIIIGIASLVIGEALINKGNVVLALAACLLGSMLYRILISVALYAQGMGLQASDLNLITAVLVVTLMLVPKLRSLQ